MSLGIRQGCGADLSTSFDDDMMLSMADLEDTLFELTVWLCSHRGMVHMNEYMVASSSSSSNSTWSRDETMEQKSGERDLSSDDTLFQELLELDCLGGMVSLPAASWRVGIDVQRLRIFVERHPLIRIVCRPFEAGDDWGRLFD